MSLSAYEPGASPVMLVADALHAPTGVARVGGAFSASLLVHGLALAGVLWFMRAPATDDAPQLASIAVEIVSTQSASDTESLVDSDAALTLTARGVTTIATAEMLESVSPVAVEATSEAEPAQALKVQQMTAVPEDRATPPSPAVVAPVDAVAPVQSASAAPAVSATRAIEPLAVTDNVLAVSTAAVEATDPVRAEATGLASEVTGLPKIEASALVPAATGAVEPTPTADTVSPTEKAVVRAPEEAPVSPRTVTQPAEAKPRPPAAKPAVQPAKPKLAKPTKSKPEVAKPPARKTQQASAGSGGNNEANSTSSARTSGGGGTVAAGGSGAESNYNGVVKSAVSRAFRFPRQVSGNSRGTATVRFVVAANGGVSGIALLKSAGSPVVDEAALAAVSRAAPFPPIPASVGKSSMVFQLPIHSR